MANDEIVDAKNQNGNYSGKTSSYSSYLIILIPSGFIIILIIISFYNYLLFHSLAEVISIVIAFGIFMVVWNSRKFFDNNFFVIIGIAYAFVAIIDFLHAATYKGINIFPGITSNLPTQLWTAARYLQSFSLIAASLFISKKIKTIPIIAIYIFILSFILFSIFSWHIFPNCFIEDIGLTPFKKASEFIISLLIFCSIIILYKKKNNFDQHLFYLVISSNIVNIASELNFTLYQTPYSNTNLIGHLLKIVSFYLMYKAIIVSGLKDPFNVLFRKLKQKDEALHLTRFSIDHAENLLFWIKPDGKIYDFNDTVIRKLGYSEDELFRMSFPDICYSPALEIYQDIKEKISKCKSFEIEHAMITKDRRILEMEMEFNYLMFEGKEYYCTFVKDITDRKKIEEKLVESESRFHNLADTAPVMIWMTDPSALCVYCNKPWMEFTGRSLEDELGYGWADLIHPDERSACIENFTAEFNKRRAFNYECRLKRQDGQYRWILNTGIPRFTTTNSFLGYIGSCIDITEIKRSREEVENSLKEKVVLLKEIHHRVKNNLQVISSLFNLQSAFIHDEEAKEIFLESQNRVKSMALLHEKLYLTKDSSCINFSDYLRDLITNLINSHKLKRNIIDLELKIDDLETNIDLSVYLGLIVNELVSNSFKHAFPKDKGFDGSKSKLDISLIKIEEKKYSITIKDNGCGFPENLDFRNTNSLGMQLVISLVDQIKGTIELKRKNGTEFTFDFEVK